MERRNTSIVQSIDRALDILEVLANEEGPLRLTELSRRLSLHKSTTHRLLSSLIQRKYVDQDPETGKYRLGLKVFEIGSLVFNKMELRVEARPFLEELMQKTLETVHLVILDEGQAIYIDKVESPQKIRMYSEIGKRTPLHCTSVGKALLAYLPEPELNRILRDLDYRRFTPNTITSAEELKEHLARVRSQGFAIDDAEHEEGIRCVAAPIFNYTGKVIATISVSGPTIRVTRERLNELIPIVMEVSQRISRRLGYNQLNHFAVR